MHKILIECCGRVLVLQVHPFLGLKLIPGEILWSGRTDSNGVNRTLTDAAVRLQEFRERMVVRGTQAEPFTQQWCVQRRGECSFPAPVS